MFSSTQALNSFGDVDNGIANPGENDKTGTDFPPMDRQPTQAEASPAERSDLLRQLVPVISPAVLEEPEAMIASATTVHDPHPDRLPIPDDNLSSTGCIKDANADLF